MAPKGWGCCGTEFLYLEDTQPPSEEKQLQVYREIFEVMGNRPVIVRTLDIGGDKPPAYLPFPKEMNPFLGWRAISGSVWCERGNLQDPIPRHPPTLHVGTSCASCFR